MAIIFNYVAELQGLYGPFTMAERVVQKIWLREDFARDRATLTDGRAPRFARWGRGIYWVALIFMGRGS